MKLTRPPLEPVLNYVLIRPDAADPRSRGGLWLPEGNRPKATRGVVLAVGPGLVNDRGELVPVNPRLKQGVAVLFNRRAASGSDGAKEFDGCLCVPERHVLAMLG